jgi:hypothetical protein
VSGRRWCIVRSIILYSIDRGHYELEAATSIDQDTQPIIRRNYETSAKVMQQDTDESRFKSLFCRNKHGGGR